MKSRRQEKRDGVVAVEFAVVAPVLLALVMGVIEVNRVYDAQNLLITAAREGARFASLDREGLVAEGSNGNETLTEDVLTILESNGIERDQVNVEIKDYENPNLDFDIDDPSNDLRLFEVRVTIDFSAVSFTPVQSGSDFALTGSVVFRNGRAVFTN